MIDDNEITEEEWIEIDKSLRITAVIVIFVVSIFYLNNAYGWVCDGCGRKIMIGMPEPKASEWIASNIPHDAGIMAGQGYTIALIYMTDMRVVGLYGKPEKLDFMLDYYNISYIVFGYTFTFDKFHLSEESARYVQAHPEKYELIQTIHEDYSQFFEEETGYREDTIWIYRVLENTKNFDDGDYMLDKEVYKAWLKEEERKNKT